MEKKINLSVQDELLRAREQGLDEIRKRVPMRGHGKILGMDVFSWEAPNFDQLATAVSSFPFPVIWIAKHEQVRCALTYYPELCRKVESAIIYDQANITFKKELYNCVETIIGLGDINDALKLIPVIAGKKNVLLFTTDLNADCEDLRIFKEFTND